VSRAGPLDRGYRIGAAHIGQYLQFHVFIDVCRANALKFFFGNESYLNHYSLCSFLFLY
jgi:hypothetical protein